MGPGAAARCPGKYSPRSPGDLILDYSAGYFACGAVGVMDRSTASGGSRYDYFDDSSRKLIMSCGPRTDRWLCPPPAWTASGCEGKWQAFLLRNQAQAPKRRLDPDWVRIPDWGRIIITAR